MNIAFMEEQLKKDSGKIQEDAIKVSLERGLSDFVSYSRVMWGYLGYSLTSDTRPFFEDNTTFLMSRTKTREKFLDFLAFLRDNDISMYAYTIIVFSIISDSNFAVFTKLHSGRGERSWIKKFRKFANSSEELDEFANFLLTFITLQVEKTGQAFINRSSVVKDDPVKTGKYMQAYHSRLTRIRSFKELSIDPIVWLEEKVNRYSQFYSNQKIHFTAIVNSNGVDPDLEEVRILSNDSWRHVRQFLGLPTKCAFVDGYIPKGWGAASDDRDSLDKVVYVTGDGYYYYADGTQRKGKRHYANNLFFVIKCTPANFEEFKATWHDLRRLSGSPTWEEYSKWGKTPDVWDSFGDSKNGRVKSVVWRKK